MPKQVLKHQSVDATLTERGKVHGPFAEHARIAQAIKAAMRLSVHWDALPDDVKESLEMIAHKQARVLNGGDTCADSYHDIAGYAVLVERRLNGVKS